MCLKNRMYMKELEEDYDQVFGYGIAFFRKRCLVNDEYKNDAGIWQLCNRFLHRFYIHHVFERRCPSI